MKTRNVCIFTVITVLVLLTAGPAMAYYIDFTSFAVPNVNNQLANAYYTEVLPSGLTITFMSSNRNGVLWWDSTDGFGIAGNGYEQDEVEQPEVLSVQFNKTIHITSFTISDLFIENGYAEIGWWGLNGLFTSPTYYTAFQQFQDDGTGLYTLSINAEISSRIYFSAPGLSIAGQNHEFSLAGVEITPVPLPGALWLLGSGLICLLGLRKKF